MTPSAVATAALLLLFAGTVSADPPHRSCTNGALITDELKPTHSEKRAAFVCYRGRWMALAAPILCNPSELIDASQAWARATKPEEPWGGATVTTLLRDLRPPSEKLRDEAEALARKELIESRWRRAVESCSP